MDAALKQEFRERAAEDDRLYDQFGASLWRPLIGGNDRFSVTFDHGQRIIAAE